MIALFDLDSLVYDSLYRIVSFDDMRKMILSIGKKKARIEIVDIAYNRMEQMIVQILAEIEACA